MIWVRYRLKTLSIEDYRPLVFNESYPWWCSGTNDSSATIIAWLPKDEPLDRYWDDAFEIESTEHAQIEFTSRFPMPEYYKPFDQVLEARHE